MGTTKIKKLVKLNLKNVKFFLCFNIIYNIIFSALELLREKYDALNYTMNRSNLQQTQIKSKQKHIFSYFRGVNLTSQLG